MRASRREKVQHALIGTQIGLGLGGTTSILNPIVKWASTLVQPSKAEQRRVASGQIIDADPGLTAIRDRVRAIPARTREEAEARAETVIAQLSAPERNSLLNAMAGLAHSGQFLRQLGRGLFAPEFAGGSSKWQGNTLPLGIESHRLNPGRVLELLGIPIAADAPAAQPAQPAQPGTYYPSFDRTREALGFTPTQGSTTMPYFDSLLGGDSGGFSGGGFGDILGGLFGTIGQIGSSAVSAALTKAPKINYFGAMPGSTTALPGGAMLNWGSGVTTGQSVASWVANDVTSPWRSSGTGATPQPYIASNPISGRTTWFRPAGRPILWSGDLGACKRVSRVARRAKRRAGGR